MGRFGCLQSEAGGIGEDRALQSEKRVTRQTIKTSAALDLTKERNSPLFFFPTYEFPQLSNPGPLGLFGFALTTALLQVRGRGRGELEGGAGE